MQITELDVPLKLPATKIRLAEQADAYRIVTETCLAESACTAITTWGFTDRYSWANQHGYGAALMLDENYQEKPAYQAVKAALLKEPSQR